MTRIIDARMMEYPEPYIAAKKALDAGDLDELTVWVSDIMNVDFLTQLTPNDMAVGVGQKDGVFAVVFRKKGYVPED